MADEDVSVRMQEEDLLSSVVWIVPRPADRVCTLLLHFPRWPGPPGHDTAVMVGMSSSTSFPNVVNHVFGGAVDEQFGAKSWHVQIGQHTTRLFHDSSPTMSFVPGLSLNDLRRPCYLTFAVDARILYIFVGATLARIHVLPADLYEDLGHRCFPFVIGTCTRSGLLMRFMHIVNPVPGDGPGVGRGGVRSTGLDQP
jgi:hypothetical protein